MRKILPSMHFLENFMPIMENEMFAVNLLNKASEIEFYKAIELGFIKDKNCRQKIRDIVNRRNWQLTQWCSPIIANKGLSLSNLDKSERKKAIKLAKELLEGIADCGAVRCGLQSGPDTSPELREDAKAALLESFLEISEEAKKYKDMYLLIEPLDRYAHKKQLLGPIEEVVEWFKILNRDASNVYIHWDSAHEMLSGANLIESLKKSAPYVAQFHICNCVVDKKHPYYGDHHMDIGVGPQYDTWGYLTPKVAAKILKTAEKMESCKGIDTTYCALEVRAHLGDDLWEKEKRIRSFLETSFNLANIKYS